MRRERLQTLEPDYTPFSWQDSNVQHRPLREVANVLLFLLNRERSEDGGVEATRDYWIEHIDDTARVGDGRFSHSQVNHGSYYSTSWRTAQVVTSRSCRVWRGLLRDRLV